MVANGSSQGSTQPSQDSHMISRASETTRRPKMVSQEDEIVDDLDEGRSKFSSSASQSVAAPLIQTISQLRVCTSSEFKKSVQSDGEKYAIEILPAQAEQTRSKKNSKAAIKVSNEYDKISKTFGRPNAKPNMSKDAALLPQKIRISSFQILGFLARFDKEIEPRRPIVMKSPFKFLVHYEKQIRESFEAIGAQVDEDANSESSTDFVENVGERTMPDGGIDTYVVQNENENRRHLQCLIQFIDEYLMPTITRLEDNQTRKVCFQDLWFIFKPGEIVYMPIKYSGRTVSPNETLKLPETLRGRYNRMWRVVGVRHNSGARANSITVCLYHIDFDGRFYIPITHDFDIMPFENERDIRSLDFFPVRFTKEFQSTAKDYFKSGKRVFDCMRESFTHFYYAGPTLMTQPCGCPFPQDEVHQQYVESEVIVDFRATLLQHQAWRPDPKQCRGSQRSEPGLEDRSAVTYITGSMRVQGQSFEHDLMYDDYYIDMNRELAFKDREIIFAPISSSWICNESSMPEQDTELLPPRVFAFVLRTRTFAPLLLWALRPIEAQTNALRNLQLKDDNLKDTVEALVRTHFLKAHTESTVDVNYDSLRGRGKGLVILLHGAPGVGKTFTAESLAAANGKPLFQISCGDLGLSPKEVEKSLRDIFRYAQMWKCVLLLDECDVFLAQRGKDDIKRNALVCVFLRVLEFYTGILFLTTNRVGVIDDAVRSRITWMAYYPPLNAKQTQEIWKANLDRIKERNPRLDIDRKGIMNFAKEHFYKSQGSNSNWDGRQIQNASQVAVSLADWEHFSDRTKHAAAAQLSSDEAESRYPLTAEHFRRTAAGVEETDQYLREATGFTGAERAFNALERADDFKEKEDEDEQLQVVRTLSLPHPDDRRSSASLTPKRRETLSYMNGGSQTYISKTIPPQTSTRAPTRGSGKYGRDVSPRTSPQSRRSSVSVAIHQPTDEWTGQRRPSHQDIGKQWYDSEAEDYEAYSSPQEKSGWYNN